MIDFYTLRQWVKFTAITLHMKLHQEGKPHLQGCEHPGEDPRYERCGCLCHESFLLCDDGACRTAQTLMRELRR